MTFLGFIMFLWDVILGNTPYLARSYGVFRFMQKVPIERMSLLCYSLLFLHVSIRCHTGAYPIVIGTIWRLVCANSFHREDEPHYDISGRCHPRAYFPTFLDYMVFGDV